jgi:hypothetical protein
MHSARTNPMVDAVVDAVYLDDELAREDEAE